MDEIFFFDTYAFFEIINGNPAYEKYMNCDGITTIFNIAELNYNLKKSKDKKSSRNWATKKLQTSLARWIRMMPQT